MKPQSAKAKGRKLQQHVRDKILDTFPHLELDDVRSTSMGAGGEDILLSPLARKSMPWSIECKSKAKFAGYTILDQADGQNDYPPLAVVKANQRKPIVMCYLDDFLELAKEKRDD